LYSRKGAEDGSRGNQFLGRTFTGNDGNIGAGKKCRGEKGKELFFDADSLRYGG